MDRIAGCFLGPEGYPIAAIAKKWKDRWGIFQCMVNPVLVDRLRERGEDVVVSIWKLLNDEADDELYTLADEALAALIKRGYITEKR